MGRMDGLPRTAVITGAASGIGRSTAVALGEKGWKVGVLDIDAEGALETAALVDRAGGFGEARPCDVTDLDSVAGAADHFFSAWGEVGILMNNAGVGGGGYVGEITMKDWKAVVGIDFWGVLHGCHCFVPRMKEQGRGHVVNTASTAGLMSVLGFSPYCAAKAAVVSLSQTLKMELAPFGIGVSVLCPSTVKTNIIETTLCVLEAEQYEEFQYGVELIQAAFESSGVTVEEVTWRLLKAVDRNRLYVLTDTVSRLNWLNVRISPELFYRLWAFLHKHGLARPLMKLAAKKGIV